MEQNQAIKSLTSEPGCFEESSASTSGEPETGNKDHTNRKLPTSSCASASQDQYTLKKKAKKAKPLRKKKKLKKHLYKKNKTSGKKFVNKAKTKARLQLQSRLHSWKHSQRKLRPIKNTHHPMKAKPQPPRPPPRRASTRMELEFLKAVVQSEVYKIRQCLQDVDVNVTNNNGDSALHLALKNSIYKHTIIFELLNHNIDLSIKNKEGNTPIHICVIEPIPCSIMRLLLEKGAWANGVNNNGDTPLNIALANGYFYKANILATFQGRVKFFKTVNRTLLHKLIKRDFPRLAQSLVKIVSDLNVTDEDGNTALHLAIKMSNLKLIDELLWYGASLEVINNRGRTPLQLAVFYKSLNVAKNLIDNGACTKRLLEDGWPELVVRAIRTDKTLNENFLKKQIDLNIQNEHGFTALHMAAWYNNIALAKQLIENHVNVDVKNKMGDTPLLISVWKGHNQLSSILIANGADVNAKNNLGKTVLHKVVKNNNFVLANVLLQSGVDIDAVDVFEETPLHVALTMKGEKMNMSRDLVQCGARGDNPNRFRETALHIALRINNPWLLTMLILNGAKGDTPNSSGYTAFLLAIIKEDILLVEMLMRNGVRLDAQDKDGNSALHILGTKDYPNDSPILKIVDSLLEHNVPVDVRNKFGKTPLDVARHSPNIMFRIVRHVLKLQLAGISVKIALPLDPWVRLPAQLEHYTQTQTHCLQELKNMNTLQTSENTRLIDVIRKINNPFYLKNDETVKGIEAVINSKVFLRNFPMYGSLLRKLFCQSKERFCLLTRASKSMLSERKRSCCRTLPEMTKRQIFSFLSNDDLVNLINSD